MNIILWILQFLFGIYFILVGVMHFVVPPNLPPAIQWMYALPTWLHYFSGTAEILGGLGLILPGITRIQTRLTPLAAFGLVMVMLGAMIYHISRGEYVNLITNFALAALLAFVAFGRWWIQPLTDRDV